MEKIKIRYAALVRIDAWEDANDPHNLPYDEIKRNVEEGITKEIKAYLEDMAINDGKGEVAVVQLAADVWEE